MDGVPWVVQKFKDNKTEGSPTDLWCLFAARAPRTAERRRPWDGRSGLQWEAKEGNQSQGYRGGVIRGKNKWLSGVADDEEMKRQPRRLLRGEFYGKG